MTTDSEDQLHELFEAAVCHVQASPDAYLKVQAQWRRRERCRRLIVALLAVGVIAAADGIAVWALSDAPADTHVIFKDPNGAGRP